MADLPFVMTNTSSTVSAPAPAVVSSSICRVIAPQNFQFSFSATKVIFVAAHYDIFVEIQAESLAGLLSEKNVFSDDIEYYYDYNETWLRHMLRATTFHIEGYDMRNGDIYITSSNCAGANINGVVSKATLLSTIIKLAKSKS